MHSRLVAGTLRIVGPQSFNTIYKDYVYKTNGAAPDIRRDERRGE